MILTPSNTFSQIAQDKSKQTETLMRTVFEEGTFAPKFFIRCLTLLIYRTSYKPAEQYYFET